jgi:hypothetical protein
MGKIKLSLSAIVIVAGLILTVGGLFLGVLGFVFWGVLLLFLRVILLATKPKAPKNATDVSMPQPSWVRVFGGAILIGSVLIFFWVFLTLAFGFVNAGVFYIICLVIAGLILSLFTFKRTNSKWLWHAIMVYLFSVFAFSIAWDLVMNPLSYLGPSSYLIALPLFLFSLGFIVYFLTKKPRQYFHVVNHTFKWTCCLYSSIIMAVSVFLVFIQILGVPVWWVFGGLNTYDYNYHVYLHPENPEIGDNVTLQISSWGAYKGNSWFYNVSNAAITVEANGMESYTVTTDKNGIASFVYEDQPTVLRANYGSSHSQYITIPATPISWQIDCQIAFVGAVCSGLFVGLAIIGYFKKKAEELVHSKKLRLIL